MNGDRDQEPGLSADAPASHTGYAVGYGKPPLKGRFTKGRFGNPKGRPKGSKSAKSLLEQALSAPVTVDEGGTTRVMEQRMALFKSLVARAIKGDARAAALVVKLMEQFDMRSTDEKNEPLTVIIQRFAEASGPAPSSTGGVKEVQK